MTLSEFSIKRPVFAWMLMSALIIFGGISFSRMGISQLPDVDFPILNISLRLDGASPEVMELDVVDPIEDTLMTVEGIKGISSTSRTGAASITIEFDINQNIDLALQSVQSKIAQVQNRLPRELEPPVVRKTNPEDQPIMWLAVSSEKLSRKDLMVFVRDQLRDQFSRVAGVGDIQLGGFVDPNLRVWVDQKKLDRYLLSVSDLVQTVENEHVEPPAGTVEDAKNEFGVRTPGEAKSVGEFSELIINSRGGGPNFNPIKISEVARIEEGLADVRRLSRANGRPAVGIGIQKQRGSNAVAVAQAVKARMLEIQSTLPSDVQIGVNFDSTQFIEEAVGELNHTLLLAAILTALVCWWFLGSLSSTINVVLAIPTSIVGTFLVLYFSGFTLNTFTLLGLSLSIGIVVDDAIMMLENIIRHKEMGKSKEVAARDGANEIQFAALVATVSIMAIFVPVVFMDGIIGKFLFQFGVTITVAVALSLVEALTLTPMRCAQFLDVSKRTTKIGLLAESMFNGLRSMYERSLRFSVERPVLVLVGAGIFFGVSLFSISLLNKEFVPSQDQSRFLMRVQTPVGSSLAFTDSKFKQVEAFLSSRPEVLRFYASIGGFGGGEVNTGVIFVTLKDKGDRPVDATLGRRASQADFIDLTRSHFRNFADAKVFVQDLSTGGFTGSSRGFPIEFSIRGPDWNQLGRYGEAMMQKMESSGLFTDINSDYQLGLPEIQVLPDRQKASLHGVSVAAIGQTVNALTNGLLVGKYPKDGRRLDIRLKIDSDASDYKQAIKNLFVRNNRGELISLDRVTRIEEKRVLQSIARKDRERAISITANIARGQSQDRLLNEVQVIANQVLSDGYRVVFTGSAEAFRESFMSLFFVLALGILVAYMVLASQFNSFIDPITVLLALPFSISGALIFLLLTNQSVNLYSVIGLILLMGIVKKNSILLVEFTNQVRDSGVSDVKEALRKACPIRLRPILMTSFATIAGAVPGALALGAGAETRIPMSIAVIGGVFVSTFLTLYVVPSAYLLLSRLEKRRSVHFE